MEIQYKPTLPQKKLPIVIIGARGIVKDAHLPAYQKAGFEVIGITNRTKARAEKLAREFNIPNVSCPSRVSRRGPCENKPTQQM